MHKLRRERNRMIRSAWQLLFNAPELQINRLGHELAYGIPSLFDNSSQILGHENSELTDKSSELTDFQQQQAGQFHFDCLS